MVRTLLTLTALLTLATPNLAWAHFPIMGHTDSSAKKPHILLRPFEKSVAIYTKFESPEDVDVYEFELTDDDLKNGSTKIFTGTVVPACAPLKNLLTTWILIGPRQDSLADTLSPELQALTGIKAGDGSLLVTNSVQGEIWHEPFTDHWYFMQKRQTVQLRIAGLYKIFVFPSPAAAGDYVFEFGDKEMWSVADILHTLWLYPKLLFESEISTKACVTSSSP